MSGLAYELIRSRRKTLALEVTGEGEVVVRAPMRLARKTIEDFVARHEDWIREHQVIQRERRERHPEPGEEERAELIRLAKERHLLLVEAAPTTFLPNFQILKRELPRVGRVKLVLANYSQYSSRYDAVLRGEVPNIFNPAYAGGCLMDINFYNVYLNAALFGRPQKAVYYPNRHGELADTSGIMVMQYEGFVSTNAGAKDTWGVNFFQIEGEQGYIYIQDGSNGLARIRVVTKKEDITYNQQDNPDRWYYEVQELTRLLLADDYDSIYSRLDITLKVTGIIEDARRAAGILFPGD